MDRSKELCKLLGVEPKYKINWWFMVWNTEIVDTVEQAELKHEYFKTDKSDKYEIIYPKLTKPSNFVKLLDLLNAYLDIRCDCLMAVVPQIIDKAIFLASTNSSRFIEKKDKFKKQAQQTEWEY